MPVFSKRSRDRLNECHPDLIKVMELAITRYDFTVLCGHRGKEDQEDAFRRGCTKVHFPNSMHNKTPALAVDIAPYPVDWNDTSRFTEMANVVKKCAEELGVTNISWGGDWKKFKDMPHFEVKV